MEAISRPKSSVSVTAARDGGFERIRVDDPFTLVIFGASGDLSKRKLIPALFQLQQGGFLPSAYKVIGFSRSPMTDGEFRDTMLEAVREHAKTDATPADPLLGSLHYHAGNADDPESFRSLREHIEALEKESGLPGNRLFYLSVAPEFFAPIIRQLHSSGLVRPVPSQTWSRVIIEKPFGRDLESALALNREVTSVLDESQIYRIDHYLGKETVQNILSFRFGNSIFEPLFSQKHVDNVQITVAETLGMEGRRGAYYETAGALRDMVQNHMMQLLCLIAMEPPSALEARSIRDEKVKVMRALPPLTRKEVAAATVRGQYGVGEIDGKVVKGYRQEEGVDPKSVTESYVAIRIGIDNWRWAGVPFLLRTGKRLKKRVSEIAVVFKQPPMRLFRQAASDNEEVEKPVPRSNRLVMRIQPNEGISLAIACKQPGMKIELADVDMDFYYGESFRQRSPEAYERLLLDALRGDPSLFTRSDEVEYSWRFITSIHEGWASLPRPAFPNYYPFTDGPDEANRLLEGTTARWRSLDEM